MLYDLKLIYYTIATVEMQYYQRLSQIEQELYEKEKQFNLPNNMLLIIF